MNIEPPPQKSRDTHHAPHPTPYALRTIFLNLPQLLLALLILTYTLYFSWYTLNRHNTLNSYAADLSLIDQPMWNTGPGPGYFMELTWGDRQQPRLAEHFEPILVPLALLFYLWDDVRLLLIAQSLILALGALPIFWVARHQLTIRHSSLITHHSSLPKGHSAITRPSSRASWAALIFALVYLLFPHLQAANIADFHADPFVVTPLLFAFWYATQQRWGWMWFWALIAISTKETLPTLTAMLGLFLILDFYRSRYVAGKSPICPEPGRRIATCRKPASSRITGSQRFHGLLLVSLSTAWFLIATYGIVAPLAQQYFGADGPIYFAHRYTGGLAGLPQLLQDPARWRYLLGLLAAAGFLPLLAPELLLLGLPVLVANLVSNFPGQYSGEQHYSAPLVVAFVLAAIYGTRRLIDYMPSRAKNGQSLKITALTAVLLWLLTWSLAYHARYGWTPLSIRTENYQMTPAAARLNDFTDQIPADAVVSASAAIHPHLAHRRIIYIFPLVSDAQYLLVDVTDIPGVHPVDAHAQIMAMLNADWQLLQAERGLLLAQRASSPAPSLPCSPTLPLPCAFYDFVRATTPPTYPTRLAFGDGRLKLLGYDVHDDPDDGVIFRFYWQTTDRLPDDLRLWPLVYDDLGQLLSDPSQIPLIATIWYPPAGWQPGEIIVTETLPQLLPDSFHLGLAVGPADSYNDYTQRSSIISPAGQDIRVYPGNWGQLASFKRQGPFLTRLPPTQTMPTLTNVEAQFGPAIHLTGFWLDPDQLQPGSSPSLLLTWTATSPLPTDYTVFVHLLAPDGTRLTQHDAYPSWLTPQPTSQWPLHQPILDRHILNLPPDLPPGMYTLHVGLYNAQTMERLPLPDGREALPLTEVEIK